MYSQHHTVHHSPETLSRTAWPFVTIFFRAIFFFMLKYINLNTKSLSCFCPITSPIILIHQGWSVLVGCWSITFEAFHIFSLSRVTSWISVANVFFSLHSSALLRLMLLSFSFPVLPFYHLTSCTLPFPFPLLSVLFCTYFFLTFSFFLFSFSQFPVFFPSSLPFPIFFRFHSSSFLHFHYLFFCFLFLFLSFPLNFIFLSCLSLFFFTPLPILLPLTHLFSFPLSFPVFSSVLCSISLSLLILFSFGILLFSFAFLSFLHFPHSFPFLLLVLVCPLLLCFPRYPFPILCHCPCPCPVGYRVRLGSSTDKKDTGRLHVDFAQARDDLYEWECRQRMQAREERHRRRIEEDRMRPPSPPPIVHFSEHESSQLGEKLKGGTRDVLCFCCSDFVVFVSHTSVVSCWLDASKSYVSLSLTFHAV